MVFPFTLFQRCLRLGNCLLASLTMSLPGGLFLPTLVFTPSLLPLERNCGLVGRLSSVVRGTCSFGFARVFFGLGLGPPPGKSVGRSACSLNGPSDPTGRLRTTPGFDMVAATTSAIAALLGDTLMEKIAPRAPGFQGRLHRRRRYRQVVKAKRRLVCLQFSRHCLQGRQAIESPLPLVKSGRASLFLQHLRVRPQRKGAKCILTALAMSFDYSAIMTCWPPNRQELLACIVKRANKLSCFSPPRFVLPRSSAGWAAAVPAVSLYAFA